MSVVKKSRARWRWFFALVAMITVFGALGVPPMHAEDGVDRKVKNKIEPQYPEIARKMGITGTVRLEVVIAPNGSIKETKVIGGHPILVNAAVDAVKKWKYEAASAETTGTLEFKFVPNE